MSEFCDKCGHELKNENSKFCDKCGAEVKYTSNNHSYDNNSNFANDEKNMAIALLLSFIWSGLGLIYAGNMEKGIIFILAAIIFQFLFLVVWSFFGLAVFIIWIVSMYETYKEVNEVNQQRKMLLINSMNR